jgi:hypothetical protein
MPAADRILHVRIQADNRQALAGLPMAEMDRGCTGGIRTRPDGKLVVEAIVKESVLRGIKDRRLKVEVLADVAEEGKKKQRQVGRGNRFRGENTVPRGLGKKVREGSGR